MSAAHSEIENTVPPSTEVVLRDLQVVQEEDESLPKMPENLVWLEVDGRKGIGYEIFQLWNRIDGSFMVVVDTAGSGKYMFPKIESGEKEERAQQARDEFIHAIGKLAASKDLSEEQIFTEAA